MSDTLNKGGRPTRVEGKKGKAVAYTLRDSSRTWVEKAAAHLGMSRSDLVDLLIEQYGPELAKQLGVSRGEADADGTDRAVAQQPVE